MLIIIINFILIIQEILREIFLHVSEAGQVTTFRPAVAP